MSAHKPAPVSNFDKLTAEPARPSLSPLQSIPSFIRARLSIGAGPCTSDQMKLAVGVYTPSSTHPVSER
jgi:hypothetical protein